MSFISLEYIVFFCTVIPLYFIIPHRWRWLLLLVASAIFYMVWRPEYILVILAIAFTDFWTAQLMRRTEDPRRRKLLLTVSLIANLSVLFFFKYFNFFNDSLGSVFGALHISYSVSPLDLILPLGISFHTFQSMGYAIDVYRGQTEPERNMGIFALFVLFFPQLVAGPIERANHMLPQFRQQFNFDYDRVVEGLRQVLWGFFKKTVIADRLAIYVNAVYNDARHQSGAVFIIATIFFAFQIYCDFSGYTDIALGTAKILGFNLTNNFRQPYLAQSIGEFWRRWHISLSNWIRDYLFFPLSRYLLKKDGRRHPRLVQFVVSVIVMLLVGLWHGAAWTFVIWGGLHGLYLGIESLFGRRTPQTGIKEKAIQVGKVLLTFTLVCFAWIFFRASSVTVAGYIISHMFVFTDPNPITHPFANALFPEQAELIISIVLIAFLILVDIMDTRWSINKLMTASPAVVRWALYYSLTIAVLFSGLYGQGAQPFIYFQF
jgi:D-alanyl-lipoteichoic acid acyltransferase DltB (MBOAT superfamily)